MKQILIHNTFSVSFPDDFYEVSEEEKVSITLSADDRNTVLKAPELHIIVSIAWKEAGGVKGFFSKLLTGKDLVKNMETCYKKHLKAHGYHREDSLQCQAGGVNADGFRYTYTAQGIEMTGESYALKKDEVIYYIHFCYRTEVSSQSRATMKAILDSAQWM